MIVCQSCGTENVEGGKFCSECGYPLVDARPKVEERKVVSVVFCDLVGSTARAERLDPEDVRAELSSFYLRVREELERRGGTVEKFIGDAVVAVFGAPAVHEDDAERAVRAALAIREWAVEEGVELRLAVNTGEALVTVGARPESREGLVAGDVINTAARLQSAAPVNGVLVGEATERATRLAIEYRVHAPVEAKGKQQPIPVWEAVVARSLFGVDVELRPRTRLVGRVRELDQLLGSLARARAEREPQLVTIVGVPGMGKSRLVQELSSAIESDAELIRWRQGRSLPYGQGVSYWALGEMVKAEAGILESDPADVAEAKLADVVARICSAEEVDWIGSMLRPLIGVAEEGAGADRRGEAFAGWRRFLEGLADERPSVLVFEDLHWADDGLLDFIDGLVDWATDVPLLIVATARPELLARRPHWGGGKPNATALSLAPLSEMETAELVHAVLERAVLPADVQAAVLVRAAGNPLYAEEFARLVVERGVAADGELPVPDSLQGLIAARLDALSRGEKELLQDAAVFGKVFWRGALVDSNRASEQVDDALRLLERKEFVRRDRRSSVEGEQQYAFRHVLVRDVAYAQIPRAARAARHQQAAAWIESRVRAEDAAELRAHHYVSALDYARAVGADLGDLAGRAGTALRDAGRRAVALNAFPNATRFYEDALELTPEDDPGWPRLALEHAEATTYVDLSGGDRFLLRARDALAADAHDAARAEMVLGEYRWLRGDRGGAESHFRASRELAGKMRDDPTRLRVLANLARFAMLADEYDQAIGLARQALALADHYDRNDMRAHALNTLGTARSALGEPEGVEDIEAGLEISRRVGGPEYLRAAGNLASILSTTGDLERAAELHREGLAVAKDIGYEEPTRWLSTEIAIGLEVAGRWREARGMVDELIVGYSESPFWIEPQTRVCRARMLLAEGDVARAVVDVERAVSLAREGRSFQSLCGPLAFGARLHAELGELDEARRVTAELVDVWVETRSAYIDQWVLDAWYAARCTDDEARIEAAIASVPANPWTAAVVWLMRGEFASAATHLEEMGAISPASLARLWAAEWLVERGRRPEASHYLEPSLAFWRSVGATAYTRRAESLLAAAS